MMGPGSPEQAQPPRRRGLLAEGPMMLLLCVFTAMQFVEAIDLKQTVWAVSAFCLASLCLWYVVFYNRKTALAFGLAAAAAVMLAVILYFASEDADARWLVRIQSFFTWTDAYLKGYRTENPQYARLLAICFCAVPLALPVALFSKRKPDLFATLLPGTACFAALFIIGHKINMFWLFGFLLAAAVYGLYQSFRKNAGSYPSGRLPSPMLLVASALPASLVIVTAALALSIHAEINPLWMTGIRERVLPKHVAGPAYTKGSSIPSADFSSRLGGDIRPDGAVLMEVQSPVGGVYLRGASKDRYTGQTWEKTGTGLSDVKTLEDTALTELYVPLLIDNTVFERLYPIYTMTVKYKSFNTSVLYAPLKTIDIDYGNYKVLNKESIVLNSDAPNDLVYSVVYYHPRYDDADFTGQIRMSGSLWIDPLNSNASFVQQIDSLRESIQGQYLQLPDALPDRIRQLASTLTQGEANDYDRARAIEQYLSVNHTYTLSPGPYSGANDFVDEFLFENKRGYCTYYASAMVVLLRCAGIPSRFVEGFVLPENEPGSDVYYVTGRQAHAWAEAYFAGFGWVPFEPTSAYAGGARPTFAPTAGPAASALPSPTPMPTPLPVTEHPDDIGAAAPETPAASLALQLSLLAVLLMMAAAFAVPLQNRSNMRRKPPGEAALLLFGQCMKLMKLQGMQPENGEALSHFAQRVERLLSLPSRRIAKVVELFQLARFSTHELTEANKAMMLAVRDDVLSASKKKIGFIRFLFYKWIWASRKR